MSEITTHNGTGALLSFIERAARDPEFNVEKFSVLLDKQQEMLRERARQEFNSAMSEVMADIGPVIRDRLNPAVNRKYATLEAIDAVARPEYSKHGFAVRFGCDKPPKDGWMRITCTVSHSGGYSEQNYLDSPVDLQQGARARTPVQAVGSTITYLRRYLLQMAFNIVLADDETDDDGVRAAAASMPRAARVAERAPAYEAPVDNSSSQQNQKNGAVRQQAERTDAQWRAWLDKLRAATEVLYRKDEVVELGNRASVGEAIASGPPWVRAEVSAILAENYARFPEESTDELPEVEIVGADKVAAG